MSLNANAVPQGGKKFEVLPVATYPGRVLGVYALGTHVRQFKGEDKEPKPEVMMSYEFLDEYVKDEDGQEQLDKPRVLSEDFPFNNLKNEKAKSTLRATAIDPSGKLGGDFAKFVGIPVMLSIVHNPGKDGRIWEKVDAVSAMREKDAVKARELINKPRVFDWDEPDLEVYQSLPQWIQEKIKRALNFKGSKLEELIIAQGGQAEPPKEAPLPPKKAAADTKKEEDNPF